MIDDAADGVCAISISGVVGCQTGRRHEDRRCVPVYDQNPCTATGWLE